MIVTMKFDNGEAGALITNLGQECRAADIRLKVAKTVGDRDEIPHPEKQDAV
ncbi:MAG: hypothetical protein LBC88_09410 [Spirochaetaceae bacterium]|jgi:hypothetical protein|nr:hypothetical protein [Spirochaetaceae bacterium]